jgi:hypothetical protein
MKNIYPSGVDLDITTIHIDIDELIHKILSEIELREYEDIKSTYLVMERKFYKVFEYLLQNSELIINRRHDPMFYSNISFSWFGLIPFVLDSPSLEFNWLIG